MYTSRAPLRFCRLRSSPWLCRASFLPPPLRPRRQQHNHSNQRPCTSLYGLTPRRVYQLRSSPWLCRASFLPPPLRPRRKKHNNSNQRSCTGSPLRQFYQFRSSPWLCCASFLPLPLRPRIQQQEQLRGKVNPRRLGVHPIQQKEQLRSPSPHAARLNPR